MSVLATLALLVLAPGWTAKLRERLPPRLAPLAPWLAAPLAAQVVCAPVIAAISGTVSLAAVPANLLALPAVPVATVLGLARRRRLARFTGAGGSAVHGGGGAVPLADRGRAYCGASAAGDHHRAFGRAGACAAWPS